MLPPTPTRLATMQTQASFPVISSGRSRPGPARWAPMLVVDVVLLLVFAGLGRNAHSLDPGGLLETAWPFLVGLLLGWAAWRVHREPLVVWPRGVALWLTTVVVGMGLRLLTGEGAAPAFVLVALGVLAVFLLVPRALAGFALRRGARRPSS
jgi:hypothetical protein